MSESDNLPEVVAAINAVTEKMKLAIYGAAQETAFVLETKIKQDVSIDRNTVGYPAVSGKPPMKVSGNLMTHIDGKAKRKGFGIYEAEVGSYMEYARVLELGGNPNWKNGQKFPYMQPALEQFMRSNAVQRILAKRLRRI